MRYLISPLFSQLKIKHAFSTRLGGLSNNSYQSLNIVTKTGDNLLNVNHNLELIKQQLEAKNLPLKTIKQIHSNQVLKIDSQNLNIINETTEADSLVTALNNTILGVTTADCVPILMYDTQHHIAAAVHAGWRGTLTHIAQNSIQAMLELGADLASIHIALGPSICTQCFEVGQEVADQFQIAYSNCIDTTISNKPHFDLKKANTLTLKQLGITSKNIDVLPWCTMCDKKRFYSYRRDGAKTGQQIALITACN